MPRSPSTGLVAGLLFLILGGCGGFAATSTGVGPHATTGYRIFDVRAERYIDLETLALHVAETDVTFFGEFHDDAVAHRAQLDLLHALAELTVEVVAGLEMFERDVQLALDRYLAGEISEPTFLANARPWPNYASDYRPLVEFARDRRWSVIGTNLPQPIATAIGRGGLAALDTFPPTDRAHAASEMVCPEDAYWDLFVEAMSGQAGHAHSAQPGDRAVLRRIYEAQCARDETMAESISRFVAGPTPIVHVNGSFHSDYWLGIVPRLLRRQPDALIRVITARPVDDLRDPPVAANRDRGDYIIFTARPRATPPPAPPGG